MDLGIKKKHILITGASGGIGTEITKQFLSEGALVTAQFFTKDDSLRAFVSEFSSTFHKISADLRKEEDVRNLIENANKKFGRIDSLIANAGVWPSENIPVYKMKLDRWKNTLATNLTGPFLCIKYFNENLNRYSGEYASITLIGSTAGVFGEANHADYSSSKAALKGLMLSVKNEIVHLAPKGRINLVNPGWTVTPMAKDALQDKAAVKKILQTIPMRKVASPSDIAQMVVFLTSEISAGHISGQTLTIAGGMEGRVLFDPEEINF